MVLEKSHVCAVERRSPPPVRTMAPSDKIYCTTNVIGVVCENEPEVAETLIV